MANLFSKNRNVQALSPRQKYEQKYNTSRLNLLLVVVFTLINVLLLATNSNMYFLFSAFIPLYITDLGMFLCGRYPEEFYAEAELSGMEFLGGSFFVVTVIISVVIALLYLLAWFMSSKKRVGWIIFALVLFGIDTVGMFLLGGFAIDSILDILFHAWILYYLILGVYAHGKLKNLPPEEEPIVFESEGSVACSESTATDAVEAAAPAAEENAVKNTDTDN